MERRVYGRMAEIEDGHWWFLGRRRILRETITRCVPLPPGARLLEAGCGTGGNLAMLADFGRVSAFEPDAEARRHAGAKGPFEVCDGRLPEEVPFPADGFDLVCAFDVLEHVDDDLGSLRALARRLRPGGWMLLTVPAFPFLWSRHDETHHHKRRYVKRQLLERARQAGVTPVRVTYFNSLLFPLIAGVRLFRKLLGADDAGGDGAGVGAGHGDDEAMPPGPLNRLLAAVFAWERHLVGRIPLPAGVSLLMLARRPES